MLEAIYFLTGAGANCSFLIALDPTLVQQAAITHYKTAGFDSNQYLDKLFDLRISLRSLRYDSIQKLVRNELSREINIGKDQLTIESLLHDAWSIEPEEVVNVFGDVIVLPELTNPRLVHRIVERLQLLARASLIAEKTRFDNIEMFRAVVVWCTISERWPQVRPNPASGSRYFMAANLELVAFSYGLLSDQSSRGRKQWEEGLVEGSNVLARMPNKDKNPDLGRFIYDQIFPEEEMAEKLIKLITQC